MLFNTLDFAIFLPIVFCVYWFVLHKNLKAQNFFLLIASYFFYGYWDWRFLALIGFSSILDYFLGKRIHSSKSKRSKKWLLFASLLGNLGVLGFFKYYNFFLENFKATFELFGQSLDGSSLNIILPVGISFYTFQTLSYTIDIYRGKLEPAKDAISFFAFVSFFPQLVAGPIERASNLLPQFYLKRSFDYATASDGMRQILWGLFKKIVIADSCAMYVDLIYAQPETYGGSTLFLASVFFAFQIYGDFSGYSDIAIGTSKLFGFTLMKNFSYPYFSRDIAEFWRRWHISLSTWFRDYLYIPLGGSRGGLGRTIFNVFVIFTVSGFWHGAKWTFVAWGAVNALLFIPILVANKNRVNLNTVAENKVFVSVKDGFKIVLTFFLTVLAWIFFRSDSMKEVGVIYREIFSKSAFDIPADVPIITVILIALFVMAEWFGRHKDHVLQGFDNIKSPQIRWSVYYVVILGIIFFGVFKQSQFIYFQF